MNRDGHKNIEFFIGPEVENTPAFSKKTLFVVGKQDLQKILDTANEHGTPHVFIGANHSFTDDNDAYWDHTITTLLDKGFWVTLDYPAHQHMSVLRLLNAGIWQSRLFVPLLSVRVPHIETSSVNLTIKIDDIDFKATNPGVWCHHYNEITDSNRFTGWGEYNSDVVIDSNLEAEVEDVATPEVTAPVVDFKEETDVVLNSPDVGLDPDSASQLKEDPDEVIAQVLPTDVNEVADEYTKGTQNDPLTEGAPKKPVRKGKTA